MTIGGWRAGRGRLGGITLLLAIALCMPSVATGGEPTEQIRGAIDRGLAIVKRADLQGEVKKAQRRGLLRKELFPYFNFEEMARRSLGVHWKNRTPGERQEFVRLFTDLLENAYAGKIEGYKGEKIRFGKETLDLPYAEVKTRIVTPQGEEFSVDYRLLADGPRWRVYDIVIEGVSLVNNYRSQFAGILQKSSFEEMTKRLKETVRKQSGPKG
ncbi:MAG: ABC transporter substrate-binding protein [Deltaproteobacteria bacterium]|nr:ABC transporter substrate-binding protein [Deltaproteobacteria bacterium]